MKQQHRQVYLDLIEQLLQYVGQEGRFLKATQLLAANEKWANAEFLHTVVQAADQLQEQDEQQKAEWLQDLAHSLASSLGLKASQIPASLIDVKATYDFLEEFAAVVLANQDDNKSILSFLAINQQHLNPTLLAIVPRAADVYFEKFSWNRRVVADYFSKFGACFSEFSQGDHMLSLELAIISYQQVLKEYTYERFPQDWASVQANLALTYLGHVGEKQAEYIELAIAAINNVLRVRTFESGPEDWADAYVTLIQAYQNRICGDKAENIETAIALCQKVVQVSCSTFPEKWASAQGLLADLYKERLQGDPADNIDLAIAAYQEMLIVYTRTKCPDMWAAIHGKLGYLYQKRIRDDQSGNIELAIASGQKALQVFTREAFPEQWAAIHRWLAGIYEERADGNKVDNIELAIASYQNALHVYTYNAFPEKYARIQYKLATIYLLIWTQGNQSENIEAALACCQEALQIYTWQIFPEKWASVQLLLGYIYRNRTEGDRAENLEVALACCQQVLQIYTCETFPEQWAMAQLILGAIYQNRTEGNRAKNIEAALACYQQVLQIYTCETFPEQWAIACYNLAVAYTNRLAGDQSENIEAAITAYQQALQVYTQKCFPETWAIIQQNLANMYISKRIRGDKRDNISVGIKAYQLALQVWTPKECPQRCLVVGLPLGTFAQLIGEDWKLVIEGFDAAISAAEQLRCQELNEARRQEMQKILVDAGVYANMVQACINEGQFEKALETAERSRSKRLVDLMATKDLYYKGQIPPEIETYLQQYDDLQNQINQHHRQESESDKLTLINLMTGTTHNRAALNASSDEIKALEHQKQKIHQQLNRLDPVTAGLLQVSVPNIAAMKQLIDRPTTALLSFYTTSTSTYIFVLRQDQVTCHICPEQTVKVLHGWIFEQWLLPYLAINQTTDATERTQKQKDWASQITPFLTEIGKRLQLDSLIESHLQDIEELILVPHLYLHQIPFAAVPTQNGLLGDRFQLRHILSCQILEFCHNRPPINSNESFGVVEDATEDLPCAAFEGEQLAQLYDIPDHNRLRGRQQATVANYRHLIEQVQTLVSCQHAQFRLDEPLESRLILADGAITLGELLTPAWRLPQLSDVFLSCCETGLSFAKNRTDDIVTLATGFLCAGARSVVSTLWAVDDLATALFSIFYHQHRRTLDRPTALQQAQQDLRQITGSEIKQHYKQPLLLLLDQKFEDAEALRQKAAQQMNQLGSQSTNYDYVKQEHDHWAKVATRADDTIDRLNRLCQEPFPFQNPIYWSAFICQGLR